MNPIGSPPPQGLYDPRFEHDACGVGFIVDLNGRKSHAIVRDAIQILMNLEHRGACGCEKNTGDGAGILVQMPHRFLVKECDKLGIRLPQEHGYGVAMVFLADRRQRSRVPARRCSRKSSPPRGRRSSAGEPCPPTTGRSARPRQAGEPVIRQLFIGRDPNHHRRSWLRAQALRHPPPDRERHPASSLAQKGMFYVPSLSHRTLIYKGMLNSPQVDVLLSRPARCRHWRRPWPWCIRASAPTRSRAGRGPILTASSAHNGEINTLRGNVNWMHARASTAPLRPVRRRHQEDHADHRRDRQRLRHVRQRPGIAGARPADRCRTR